MAGRTVPNHWRIYVAGRDMSGYTRSFGPLACTFDEGVDDALTLEVKQTWLGNATISLGTLNGLFDNTGGTGVHALLNGAGVGRNVLVAAGILGAPVDNDPAFCGHFNQMGYETGAGENPVTVTIPFSNTSTFAGNLNYTRPWGTLLHASAAATAANTAVGLDQLAGTTKGGYMMYQVMAAAGTGNMTAAIKVQHSTTTNVDGSFGDLLSSGTINCVGGGASGIVSLAKSATVGRYVRWQIALTLATSVTFALAFVRGN
jgi:hypothetical protein